MEEASTLGVGITTVGQGLYQSLGLPLPTAPVVDPFPILIYGGSTATGTLAIQFAKLSGLTVLTTCSPHNFDLARSVGADLVFDYNSATVGADIRAATDSRLAHVFDCISTASSAAISAAAFGSKGGKYSGLLPISKFPRADVTVTSTLAYTAVGQGFDMGLTAIPAKPEDLAFATRFWKLAGELLVQGKFRVHPPVVREGGLDGILDGLKELRENKVHGVKLVYRV